MFLGERGILELWRHVLTLWTSRRQSLRSHLTPTLLQQLKCKELRAVPQVLTEAVHCECGDMVGTRARQI